MGLRRHPDDVGVLADNRRMGIVGGIDDIQPETLRTPFVDRPAQVRANDLPASVDGLTLLCGLLGRRFLGSSLGFRSLGSSSLLDRLGRLRLGFSLLDRALGRLFGLWSSLFGGRLLRLCSMSPEVPSPSRPKPLRPSCFTSFNPIVPAASAGSTRLAPGTPARRSRSGTSFPPWRRGCRLPAHREGRSGRRHSERGSTMLRPAR